MLGIECLLLIPFIIKLPQLSDSGKWMLSYILCSIIFASGSALVGQLFGNNMIFFSIMYMLQFIILSMYYTTVIKNRVTKLVILLTIIPVFFIFLLDLYRWEGFAVYNSYFASARNIILIVYAILFFLQLLGDEQLIKHSVFINTLPDFWFNAGLFIYLCSTVMRNLSYNYFSSHPGAATNYILSLSFVAGIIQLILIFIGLMKVKKTSHGHS